MAQTPGVLTSFHLARYALLCTVAAVIATPASGQSSLAIGNRVRLSISDKGRPPLIGALASVTADSVALTTADGVRVSVPRESILRAEVSVHRRPVLRYAWIGSSIGVVVGAIIGAASYEPGEGGLFDFGRGFYVAGGVLYGFGAGFVTGTVIGALHVSELWLPASLHVRPALLNGDNLGTRVALILRFGP
jgi:hypothetical protein